MNVRLYKYYGYKEYGDFYERSAIYIQVHGNNYSRDIYHVFRTNGTKMGGSIWSISPVTINSKYSHHTDWNKYNLTKETFLDVLGHYNPDDFTWLMFHPEIFDGCYEE